MAGVIRGHHAEQPPARRTDLDVKEALGDMVNQAGHATYPLVDASGTVVSSSVSSGRGWVFSDDMASGLPSSSSSRCSTQERSRRARGNLLEGRRELGASSHDLGGVALVEEGSLEAVHDLKGLQGERRGHLALGRRVADERSEHGGYARVLIGLTAEHRQ